jgi:Fe-S cluster assembly scaffold protein SufB
LDSQARIGSSTPVLADSLWTSEDRMEALDLARRKAIPDRKEEDWHYLNPKAFPWKEIEKAPMDGRPQSTVSFESHVRMLPSADSESDAERLRTVLAVRDEDIDAKFLQLHRALGGPIAAYRISTSQNGSPIRIVHRAADSHPAAFTTVLHIESGADAIIYNRWETNGNGGTPTIGRVEIVLERGARLHFLHEDQLAADSFLYRRARAQIAEGARLDWGVFTTGCAWHAAKMEVELQGPGAECAAYGLFCGVANRTAEHRTLQNHVYPRAASDFLFKSLLVGKSRSVYQGMIRVEKAAQRTDAYQACRNLTLSAAAHAETIPRLEILADDVRCSHGATVGTVDDDSLFYLMTRGLSRDEAAGAIAAGFAEEVIRRVPIEDIAERWRHVVRRTIGRNLI